MSQTFLEATSGFDDDEQRVLFGSIPRLIAAIASADGITTEKEVTRGIDGLIAVVTELGPEFRHSPHAEAAFDGLADALQVRDETFVEYLLELRGVLEKLPAELAARYRAFVARLCVAIARASRKYILWGKRIDEAEARVLAGIVVALDVAIDDPEVRAMLERDA